MVGHELGPERGPTLYIASAVTEHIAGCRKTSHYCFRTEQSRRITPKECGLTTRSLCKSRCRTKPEVYIHTYKVSAAISDCRSLLESPRYTSCDFAMVECRMVRRWKFDDICHGFGDISTSG